LTTQQIFDVAMGVFATVVLFLYGLQSFSREIQEVGKDQLQRKLEQLTRNRLSGFLLGAMSTAVVQSSSAVTALTAALVDAGTIGFVSSLPVLIGANVGTTVTAWLVSFKLTGIGPIFVVLGALLTVLPEPLRVAGKSVFYFGFIFFTLDLISHSLGPVKESPQLLELLAHTSSPVIGAASGALLTAVVQSSSVVAGLAILLVQQGTLDITGAVAIVIGANAGSTVTGLMASIPMGQAAKRTAQANVLFNVAGVLLFVPFADELAELVTAMTDDGGMAIATAHLIFNLGVAALTLPLVGPIGRWLAPRTTD